MIIGNTLSFLLLLFGFVVTNIYYTMYFHPSGYEWETYYYYSDSSWLIYIYDAICFFHPSAYDVILTRLNHSRTVIIRYADVVGA